MMRHLEHRGQSSTSRRKTCSGACRPCARRRHGACLLATRATLTVMAMGGDVCQSSEGKRPNRALNAHVSWYDRVCLAPHVPQREETAELCMRCKLLCVVDLFGGHADSCGLRRVRDVMAGMTWVFCFSCFLFSLDVRHLPVRPLTAKSPSTSNSNRKNDAWSLQLHRQVPPWDYDLQNTRGKVQKSPHLKNMVVDRFFWEDQFWVAFFPPWTTPWTPPVSQKCSGQIFLFY